MKSSMHKAVETGEIYKYATIALGILLFSVLPFVRFSAPVNGSGNESCDSSGGDSTANDDDGDAPDHAAVTFILHIAVASFSLFILGKSFRFFQHELQLAEEIKNKPNSNYEQTEYFFYRVDFLFSKAPGFKVAALLFVTTILVFIGSIFVFFATGKNPVECIWTSWTFIADPGTHADSDNGFLRAVALIITIGGMIIFALVIGIVTDDVGNFVENLRRGKSRVVEAGHTLIIGQGDKLMPLIAQICLANESEGGGLIVILTSQDKIELEEEIADAGLEYHGTNIIVRQGQSHIKMDLQRVSAPSARSILILSDRGNTDADSADVDIARTVLNLRALMVDTPFQCSHITCDINDIDNEELVLLIGEGLVETLVSHDVIGRLMVQCSLRQGLASVLHSLLGFDGSEFYIEEWPTLVGKTFGELMYCFDGAVVIGIMTCSDDEATKVVVNPSLDVVLGSNDKVIVIAEDNDTYHPRDTPHEIDLDYVRSISTTSGNLESMKPEKVLLVGWRRDMADLICQINSHVNYGSEVTLVSNMSIEEREKSLSLKGVDVSQLKNIEIKHVIGNHTIRKDLETMPLVGYHSVLILAEETLEASGHNIDMINADSRSMTSLILIRDIQKAQKVMYYASKGDLSKARQVSESQSMKAIRVVEDDDDEPVHRLSDTDLHASSANNVVVERLSSAGSSSVDLTATTTEAAPAAITPAPAKRRQSIKPGGRVSFSPSMSGDMAAAAAAAIENHEREETQARVAKKKFTDFEHVEMPEHSCLVTEILDSRTRSIATVANVDDYVASNEIISMLLVSIRLLYLLFFLLECLDCLIPSHTQTHTHALIR